MDSPSYTLLGYDIVFLAAARVWEEGESTSRSTLYFNERETIIRGFHRFLVLHDVFAVFAVQTFLGGPLELAKAFDFFLSCTAKYC